MIVPIQHMMVTKYMVDSTNIKIENQIGVEGIYTIEVLDKDYNVKRKTILKNRIVSSGLALVAQFLANTSSYRLKGIGVGTGQQIVTANDTTLTNPVWKDITFTQSDNTVKGIAIFGTSEANQNISEVGIRDTNNVLFSRGLNREPFIKVSGEQIRITWSGVFENKLGL